MTKLFKSKEDFKNAFKDRMLGLRGKNMEQATEQDGYKVLGSMIREAVMGHWAATTASYREEGTRQAYYFSMEFLLGRLLESNLLNMGFLDLCREGLAELGLDLEKITEQEPDAGLGNGGLGRLAACFLDSLASLGLPGHGFGLRYRYGLFEQRIKDGYQVELPDCWLQEGNVWEIRRQEEAVEVRFGGQVRVEHTGNRMVLHHEGYEGVYAVPYDMPVVGYRNQIVNTLRLWSAEATGSGRSLEQGCFRRAVEYQHAQEAISELLYPDDSTDEGKRLRLKQQYFLVSAGLQDIIRAYKARHGSVSGLERKVAVHINDTHPVLAIPELMRLLMQEGIIWERAWKMTNAIISYTNHTTLAEALEKWPVELFRSLLPHMYEIVHEINERFCKEIWDTRPDCRDKLAGLAIIADGQVKMAHLAVVGSHSVNGVAALHTEILKHREMKDFYDISPEKFNNKTNGITHRRWLMMANPHLSQLITSAIGSGWIRRPESLVALEEYIDDASFLEQLQRVKRNNKEILAAMIKADTGLSLDVDSIFDIQIKRLHGYKRQLLNVLHIMYLYNRLWENPSLNLTPRTFIFGAKAFPNYHLAKSIIKLINTVAEKINGDKRVRDRLKVVFMENYRVSQAMRIIPAADLSEQISTAGKEASGTGNMKFMLNGALTIGTLDGANVEIAEAVGRDNIFIFGLEAGEVFELYRRGDYRAWDLYNQDSRIRAVVDQLVNGFLPVAHDEFRIIHDHLLALNDEFLVLKDFDAYAATQEKAERIYNQRRQWLEMSALNIARAGRFSSDLTIGRYAREIWDIETVNRAGPGEPAPVTGSLVGSS
ncbi:MAG: glycogen/starch/alpha-glucan phosphorylase [Firmicutes bacterium]|nr:glycogen/starch/alpha-glucan phosphorylase [Bacillota bacterium]